MTSVPVVGAPAPAPPPPPSGGRRRSSPRQRLRLATMAAVLVGALVYLLVQGLGSSLNYFDTVSQAVAHKSSLGTTTFRLEGLVVPGSIRATAVGTDFTISEGRQSIAVENTGSPPGLFQQDIPVVVVGHFGSASSTTFLSNQIMVKHSQDYVAAHPNRVRAPNGSLR